MSRPQCPYCNYRFSDEDIYYSGTTAFPTEENGDITETECSNCQKPLKIALDLTPKWAFLDEEDEEIEP